MSSAALAEAPIHTGSRSSREALLEAASNLMNEKESTEISLIEISQKARANSALVKYHFGSKRGMFIALIERDIGNSVEHLHELLDSDLSATEKMRRHITGMVNLYFRYRYLNTLLLEILRESTPEEAQELSDRLIKPAADAQRAILEQGLASNEFREIEPMPFYLTIGRVADVFFTAHFALKTVYGYETIDNNLRRKLVDFICDFALQAIAAKR